MADRVGQHLGNYRLIRMLGEGGFAEVYLGEHLHLGTQAAIKVLNARLTEEDVQDFLSEARTIAHLRHPHILRVLECNVEEGIPYLVLEYAPNGTLRQRHPKGTQVPLLTILPYIRQISEALQYAHEHQIIHRDIKPENLLLGQQNRVLLSDFGIAIAAQSSRSQTLQSVAGTVSYMAPEQLQGKPRPASDQYAFAVVVYEWLGGIPPFQGTYAEIAMQHVVASPARLRDRVPTLHPLVEEVVFMALAKDPKDRFASVADFAQALEQASQGKMPMQVHQVTSLASQPTLVRPSASGPYDPNVLAAETARLTPPVTTVITPSERIDLAPPMQSVTAKQKVPSRRGISRRALLIGLVGSTGLVAAGGVGWWLRFGRPSPVPSPVPPPWTIIYTHEGAVWAVAWSPDGERIASGGEDTTVQVWNALDGSQTQTYHGHTSTVYSIAWSPNGKRIASGSSDNTVQVWDAASLGNVLIYKGHTGQVGTVSWSLDGQRIASGSDDGTLQVWDATTLKTAFTIQSTSNVLSVAWSPDGKKIAFGNHDGIVEVVDATTGEHYFTFFVRIFQALAWSSDGKYIIAGSSPGGVQVTDTTTVKPTLIYGTPNRNLYAIACSGDGKYLTTGGDGMYVYKALTQTHVFSYAYYSTTHPFVRTLAWSPKSTYLAAGTTDTVQVWRVI